MGQLGRWVVGLSLLVAACGGDGDEVGARDGGREADAEAPPADARVRDATAPDGEGGSDASSGDGATDASTAGTLAERHPGDEGLAEDPAVLFHDDFESGWGRWDAPRADTRYLTILEDAARAHAGRRFLQSKVTTADLAENMYISASPRVAFPRRVDEVWWRFHVRFPVVAPNPHHWVRTAAGTESWNRSGIANTLPRGDEGFWFDFDINNDDVFNFYVYWYKMRSGRCNDGSATPGCAGDQGTTYYYGNVFRSEGQVPFPRDEWFCIEVHAKANTVGEMDGELSFWVDDVLVGEFRTGVPEGTWLRDRFHPGGCDFSACTPPQPFEGFDFRSSPDVKFKAFFLDAYYQRDTSDRKRRALEERGLTVSDEQIIWYDDVVVATERIGCRR